MRIITLLLRHGTAKYTSAIEESDALFARQLSTVPRDLVVIDSALATDYEQRLGPGRVLIGGSNAHWEFSAWDCGLAYLGDRISDYHLIHLATSAFQALPGRYLDRFDAEMLGLILHRAAAVGHIDYFNEPVTLLGRSLQAWIRSSFIFLPPGELRLLGSLVSINDRASFLSGDPEAPFRANAPLSANYQKYIIDWLTGSGTGQGVEWHSRFGLTLETLPFFEAKAAAILNEHMLSLRLRAQGCAMVDATWLATQRMRLPKGHPLGAIPNWRWQVTARDTDAAPPRLNSSRP
jgi:hypothetical protein